MPIMRVRVSASKREHELAKARVEEHIAAVGKHELLGTDAFMKNNMSAYVKHIAAKHKNLNDRVSASVARDAAARELRSAVRKRKSMLNALLRKRAALKEVVASRKSVGKNMGRVLFAGRKKFMVGPNGHKK